MRRVLLAGLLALLALPCTGQSLNSNANAVSLSTKDRTIVMKTGSLATSATTADQVVLTYTVTAGKTLFLTYVRADARLTTFAATATYFGTVSLEIVSGTKVVTLIKAGSGVTTDPPSEFSEPMPIAAGTVVRMVCTPSAATAMTWQGNFGGYEK